MLPSTSSCICRIAGQHDPGRRKEAHIPDQIGFKTKPQLAIEMIQRAVHNGLPRGVVLADSAYGDSSIFRKQLRDLGLDYAVGVHSPTTVWRLDKSDQPYGEPMSVADVGHHTEHFRRVTWREGTKGKLWSRFAMCRVLPVRDGANTAEAEPVWLVMEWPPDEPRLDEVARSPPFPAASPRSDSFG